MRSTTYKRTTATAVATTLLLLSFLLPACSDSNGPNGPDIPETKTAKLTISLGSLDNTAPGHTKAGGPYENGFRENDIIDPDLADTEYEHHIEDWYIVIVDDDTEKVVDRVVSNNGEITNRDEYEGGIPNNDHANSETEVGITLLVGKSYSFYAFANLKGLTEASYETIIGSLNGLKGAPFDNFRKTEAILRGMDAYDGGDNSPHIPMSSYGKSAQVTENTAENIVKLELIRLLGKVSVEVTNVTGKEITVNGLTMGKFRLPNNPIYLLPYDATVQDPANPNLLIGTSTEHKLMNPQFPGTSATEEGSDYTFPSTSPDNPLGTIPADEKQPYSFYAPETAQENQGETGTDDMTIALKVDGKDESPKPTKFFFLRRNDLLKIPVLISDAETEVEFVQMHMPIGGIPTRYTFRPITIPEYTYVTDHAGEIKINYNLAKINGTNNLEGWRLKYYTDGTNVEKGDRFCYAALESNTPVSSTDTHFLVVPAAADQDPLSWWDPAMGTDTGRPDCAFKLNPSADSPTTSGSFTITLQELATAATATIKLTLVAQHDGYPDIVLPYTLTITNQTNEGGNE